jgi:hypothetical protein
VKRDIVPIRDPKVSVILASRWALRAEDQRDSAIKGALALAPTSRGALRHSVFVGVDEPILLQLTEWGGTEVDMARVGAASPALRPAPSKSPGAECEWWEVAFPYRSFTSGNLAAARCLVVVRQPMKRPDAAVARGWVDTVLRALDASPPEGLIAATFLVNGEGSVALNLAEWESAEAHRAALRPADFSIHGTLGDSPEWRAAREYPGIEPQHEVQRYAHLETIEATAVGQAPSSSPRSRA